MPWTLLLLTVVVAGAGLALNGFSPGNVPGKDIAEGRAPDEPTVVVQTPTPTPTTPSNLGTVTGRFTYEDLAAAVNSAGTPTGVTKSIQPVRFTEVVALDSNTSASPRIISFGTTTTDADGNVSLQVPFDTPFFPTIVARTTASGRANLEVRDITSAVIMTRFSDNGQPNVIASGTSNVSINFGTLRSGQNSNTAGVYNILDAGIRGSDKAAALFGTLPTTVTFIWQPNVRNGTFFNSTGGPNGGPAITIQGGDATADDTNEFDDGIILHEYGHFIAFAFSRDSSLGGPHALSDVTNPPLAYSEGLASFYACLTDATQFIVDSSAINGATPLAGVINLEGGRTSGPRGIRSEASVFEVLWDLFDGIESRTSTDADSVAIGQASFAGTLQALRGTNRYVQVEDFLELLVAGGGLTQGQMQALLAAPENQQISFPASGTDIVPVRAEPQPFTSGVTVATRATNDGQSFSVDASNRFFQFDVAVQSTLNVNLSLDNPGAGANGTGTNIDLVVLTADNVLATSTTAVVLTPLTPSSQGNLEQAFGVVAPGRYIIWVHGRPDVTATLTNATSNEVAASLAVFVNPSP